MSSLVASGSRVPPAPVTTLVDKQTAVQPQLVDCSKARNENIDVIRLVAALGIVFVHAVRAPELEGYRNFFRFAVPFFLFASLYFQALSFRRKTDRTLPQYVVHRFRRLYLPFLAWSVIYIVARDIKRVTLLHLGPVALTPGLLWKGPEYHLYFLPLLLSCSVAFALVHWAVLKRDPWWRWPLIGLAIVAGLAFALSPMPASWDEIFDNPTYAYVWAWRALPAVCWAMAFAWFMTAGSRIYTVPRLVGFAGVLLAAGCSLYQLHEIKLIPRGLSGLGCLLLALIPWPASDILSLLARIGRYSYGIYLSHVLVVELVRAMAVHGHFSPSVTMDLVIFAVSFAGSVGLVCVLGRTRWLAWLNG